MSGTARQRHQLSTLLMDAYTHRAEIEDKIAQAKRNRKESGNKYGETVQNIVNTPMLTINTARFLNLSCSPILSFAFNFIRWQLETSEHPSLYRLCISLPKRLCV